MAGIFNVTLNWKIAYEHHSSEENERKESRERVQKKVSTLDLLALLAPRSFQQ
jgi:hypothetical protein